MNIHFVSIGSIQIFVVFFMRAKNLLYYDLVSMIFRCFIRVNIKPHNFNKKMCKYLHLLLLYVVHLLTHTYISTHRIVRFDFTVHVCLYGSTFSFGVAKVFL